MRCAPAACSRRPGVADGGGHRRRRRPAGHRDPPRAGTHCPARLPRPSGRRRPAAIVRLCGAGPAASDRSIPADPGAAPVREGAGPHLPPTRLRAAGRPRRPRPRHRPRRRWADRLRQPLLPMPPPPSAQDPRPGLAVRAHHARRAAGDHPERDHPHHPPTGPARPHRATRPARTTPTADITGGTTPVPDHAGRTSSRRGPCNGSRVRRSLTCRPGWGTRGPGERSKGVRTTAPRSSVGP